MIAQQALLIKCLIQSACPFYHEKLQIVAYNGIPFLGLTKSEIQIPSYLPSIHHICKYV